MTHDGKARPEALESIQNSGGIVGYQPGSESALEGATCRAGTGKPGNDSGDIAHSPHYQAKNDPQGIYECIKVIEAWDLGFCLGNALKYISRAGRKPGEDATRDLGKASWYLQREMGDSRPVRDEAASMGTVCAQVARQWKDKFVLADAERDQLDRDNGRLRAELGNLGREITALKKALDDKLLRSDFHEEREGLEMANVILTADRDNWKKRAEELRGEEPAESVTDFDKTCPEVKPGQVWSTKKCGCGRHEYVINEKTLGKVNGQWQNGVTYYRSDQFGPRLFWREIEDFHSDFQFVREEGEVPQAENARLKSDLQLENAEIKRANATLTAERDAWKKRAGIRL